MARSISVPAQTYAVGTYGPYNVDKFSRNNTDALEFTLTVGGDWPAGRSVAVCRVTLVWDIGGGPRWTFFGGPTDQNGNPIALIREKAYLPRESDGVQVRKRDVVAGQITFEAFTPITTAITLAGV